MRVKFDWQFAGPCFLGENKWYTYKSKNIDVEDEEEAVNIALCRAFKTKKLSIIGYGHNSTNYYTVVKWSEQSRSNYVFGRVSYIEVEE